MRFIFLKSALTAVKGIVLRNVPKVKDSLQRAIVSLKAKALYLKAHYWPKVKRAWATTTTTVTRWYKKAKLILKAVSREIKIKLRRWVRLTKPKVTRFYRKVKLVTRRFARKAGKKVEAYSRKAKVLLKRLTRKVIRYVQPKVKHAYGVVRQKVSQLMQKLGANMRLYPNLWLGGAHVAITISLFSVAYVTKNWKLFHFGLASLATSPLFFINHYDKWSEVGDFISKKWDWVWLGVSVTAFALSYGHQWGLRPIVISLISTTLAVITIAEWWGDIGKGMGEGAGILWTNLKIPFQGEYRVAVTLMFGAFLAFVVYHYLYMEKYNLTGKEIGEAKSLALVMTLLFLGGVGSLIWKIHKKMS